jgi:hypothetical protein
LEQWIYYDHYGMEPQQLNWFVLREDAAMKQRCGKCGWSLSAVSKALTFKIEHSVWRKAYFSKAAIAGIRIRQL